MSSTARVLSLIAAALFIAASAFEVNGQEPTPEQAEFFQTKVLPILESRCFECHGEQDDAEAGLHLHSRAAVLTGGESGPSVVAGDPDRSLIIQAVRYESFQMPPRSKMPDEEIAILVQWVKDGALWSAESLPPSSPPVRQEFPLRERMASHWAWRPLQAPEIPDVKQQDWAHTDADRLILSRLEAEGLSPAPDADRRALIRRIYFDLIGLPPTVEEQQAFFNDPDPTPRVVEKTVDRLLASPQFGERWARHWLDLVRYGETLGHEFDFPLPYAWRYRDYVIRALNADVPYDQFVREHIAGDLLEEPRRHPETGMNESIIGTGFWFLCEDKHAPVDVKAEEALRVDNQIDVFGKTFLGLTISCARCHDHKFDPITAEDYYALSGFLQSSRRRVEWLDVHHAQKDLIERIHQIRTTARETLQSAASRWDAAAIEDLLKAAVLSDAAATARVQESDVVALRKMLSDPAAKALNHPLAFAAMAMQRSAEQSDGQLLQQILETRRKAEETRRKAFDNIPQDQNARLADLRHGMPADWFAFGQAFDGLRPRTDVVADAIPVGLTSKSAAGLLMVEGGFPSGSSQTEWVWSPDLCVAHSEGAVSSARLSPMLKGTLHSPEWELQHSEVHVLAAGKASRLRLVVDGYVMNEFTELLFSGLRQPIDTDGQFRWIRIAGDLSRYLGHRVHLEFLDENDGWFAVREVRLIANRDQTFEVPEEISWTNQLEFADVSTIPDLLNRIASRMPQDARWPDALRTGGMIAPEPLQKLNAAVEEWRQLATKPVDGEPVLVMCDGTGEDERLFVRGNTRNPGPHIPRRLMTALDEARPLIHQEHSGRLELANRVLAESNPFPARVAVNRVWQQLFGRGLVPSPDNFGVLGEAPSHPELLDHLAIRFRDDGWSLKRLIRSLVLSRTYAMSSVRNPDSEIRDPRNVLLHRANVRRIESESVRDSILAISGRLDKAMYGPSVPVYLTAFMQGRGRPGTSGPLDGAGRRSIYQSVNRNFLNPLMVTFDTPQPATTVGKRSRSNVPAQALIMLNSEFVHQQSDQWATSLLARNSGETVLAYAWQQAFARAPSEQELQALRQFVDALAKERGLSAEQANTDKALLQAVCHVLLNKKELMYLD